MKVTTTQRNQRFSDAAKTEALAKMRPNVEVDEDGERTKITRCLSRGQRERRWIAQKWITIGRRTYEYAYHATKGWRRRLVDL
jgi:hypothetical protein